MTIFRKKHPEFGAVARRRVAGTAAIVCSLMLVACDGDEPADSGAFAAQAEPDAFDGLTEVSADTFGMEPFGDYHAFDFSTGGSVVGLCVGSDGSMTCTGQASDDVPDLTYPFPGRPGAIKLERGDTEYTKLEGISPAKAKLNPGEKVTIDGVTCGAIDASTLECRDDGASFTVEGSERLISVNAGGANPSSTAASTSSRPDAQSRVSDVDPSRFSHSGGGYSFILEDGVTVCYLTGDDSPLQGVGCHVTLNDPPLSPGNLVPVSFFEMTSDGDAGLTTDLSPYERRGHATLREGERIKGSGAACTALGGADFSCEAGGTTVTFVDGESPDIPVLQGGPGAVAENRSGGSRSSNGNVRTSGSCGRVESVLSRGASGDVMVREGRVDCDEVVPIVQEYVDTPRDANHGMENWRFYGDWTCKNPRVLGGGVPMFLVSCSTDDGRVVAIENPDWRP